MNINFSHIFTTVLALDWLIRIAAFYFVPRNRKPSSATAWLMLLMLFPKFGLVIYLLIGSPKLSKTRRKKQRTMDGIIKFAVDEAQADPKLRKFVHFDATDRVNHLVKLTTKLGGMPAFSGNNIEILTDYDDNFVQLINDINNAKNFVHIEFYIIVLDDSTENLFLALESAVKRGVKVRVLFDALGSRRRPGYEIMKKTLTDIGVEWHAMLPLHLPGPKFNRPDLRNHRKIVVIDSSIGYTGSLNLIKRNYHRSDDIYYDELMVRVRGPVVTQLHAAFITDWYSESNEMIGEGEASEMTLMIESAGSTLAQVMPSGPGYEYDNNLMLFTALIHSANKKIVIVNPYFVPDDSLMIAITSAAQRGVEVTMINSEVMDQPMVGHAQRSYYEELLKAGVKILLYDRPILLHSKYITIDDDIAVVGSSNLDMRSFQLDLEVTMLIFDKKVVERLDEITKVYSKTTKAVELKAWHARPKSAIILDNIARLTAALQ